MKKRSNVVSLDKARAAKNATERERRIAQCEADLALLELNEFNFLSPDGHSLVIHEAGKTSLHKVCAEFGLPRFPETEAELLGVQQNLQLLVVAARPTAFPKEDAAWLAAGRSVIAEATPWAIAWFDAYLAGDKVKMREAMLEHCFIENAAQDWLEVQAAREVERNAKA